MYAIGTLYEILEGILKEISRGADLEIVVDSWSPTPIDKLGWQRLFDRCRKSRPFVMNLLLYHFLSLMIKVYIPISKWEF